METSAPNKLKVVRARLGLTQAELSEELEIPASVYGRCERGKESLSPKHVIRLLFLAGRGGVRDVEPEDLCDDETALEVMAMLDEAHGLRPHVDTARSALRDAMRVVDEEIGPGKAVDNPVLVASVLSAMTASYQRLSFEYVTSEMEDLVASIEAIAIETTEALESLVGEGYGPPLASAIASLAEAMPNVDPSAMERLAGALEDLPGFDSSELAVALDNLSGSIDDMMTALQAKLKKPG